jgi:putative transposase
MCTVHAGTASLAECRDLYEWFGVGRRRATIQHWHQEYAKYHNQDFIVEPDRIAVDKKQIQLENEEKAWLYTAIDVDTKVIHVQISQHRGHDPAEQSVLHKRSNRSS